MNLFKKIAKKVLEEEFEQLTDELEQSNKRLKEYRVMYQDETEKSNQLSADINSLKIECAKLKNENEILRKYYELDKEPSDEIKAKMHIDLEINRLKEEKLTSEIKNIYRSLQSQPLYYSPMYLNRWF